MATTFTLTPVDSDTRTNVKIASQWQDGGGIGRFFRRTFAPKAMRRVYTKELDHLANAMKA